MGVNTALWGCAPLAVIYSCAHIAYGFEVQLWIRAMATPAYATFLTLYIVGIRANMDEYGISGLKRRSYLTIQLLLLTPLFSLMEAAGVLSALLRPRAGFHVVKK